MEIVHAERIEHERVAAALDALRLSHSVVPLLVAQDIDRLRFLGAKAGDRDVRIGAVRALGALKGNASVSSTLRECARQVTGQEFRDVIVALVRQSGDTEGTQAFLAVQCESRMQGPSEGRFGDAAVQADLARVLSAAEETQLSGSETLVARLLTVMSSYKSPQGMRRQALRTFAAVAPMNEATVDRLIEVLNQREPTLSPAVGLAVDVFVKRLRRHIEPVRLLYGRLDALQDALLQRWIRSGVSQSKKTDDPGVRGLRRAATNVRELIRGYGEFAALKQGI